jgi:Uma2 family endonuclease
MIANLSTPKMTPQEYLDWEEQQPLRYEYFGGEVVAMTGGTIPHNQLAVNLASLLKNHLRGKGCKVLTSDAKVQLSDNGPYCYADVSVTCDECDRNARQFIRYPSLIVEVLSPSTEAFDRGEKFRKYRRIKRKMLERSLSHSLIRLILVLPYVITFIPAYNNIS